MKRQYVGYALAFLVVAALAWVPLRDVLGEGTEDASEPPPTATPHPLGATAPIVPLIVIRPGETQEMLMTSACIRITRGSGPSVQELGNEFWHNAAQECTVNGVTATFEQPEEMADYPALVEAGVKSCTLTVSASEAAEPGIIDLHLIDDTCGGDCHINVRVLVVQ